MPTVEELLAENAGLRARLEEAEETLRAIRSGEVDALVVSAPEGEQVYTLKGADHSYRVLVESISEGAATLAPGGDILYANTRLAQILGLPLERVIGSNIGEYISETDSASFAALTQSVRKENRNAGEFSLKAGDGTEVPVYLSLSNLSLEGAPDAFCVTITDLTQQKRDEALLAEGRLSQEILAQAEQAIAVCDTSGIIIKASHGLIQLCDYNPLFMPLEKAFPLIPDLSNPVSLERCFWGGSIYNEEMSFCHPDGNQVFLLVNAGPLLDEQQRPLGGVVAFTDITEHKRAEQERQNFIEQLQQARQELQTANEELKVQAEELQVQGEELRNSHDILEQRVAERTAEVVAANVRMRYLSSQVLSAQEEERKRISMELHDDLGQALLVLRMQLNAMLKQTPSEPAIRKGMEESAGYLKEIIQKVRDLSHALSPATLGKRSLTRVVNSLLEEFHKYHDIVTEADLDEVGPLLPQEACVGIYRILQEFLANVHKHAQATRVTVSIKAVEDRVAVTMEDNGIGFDLDKVNGPIRKPEGLGLLSMEGRVQMLGGQLFLDSQTGLGTRLYFEIPQDPG